jgi:TRAP-type mannitol/chloroaromatic compound transport system permease small subunit
MDEEGAGAGGLWAYDNAFTRWTEALQGNSPDAASGTGGLFQGILWVIGNMFEAVHNIIYAVLHPGLWLGWVPHARFSGPITDPDAARSLARFIYYGASVELFFAVFVLFLILTACGLVWRRLMWGMVRGLEGFANAIGRAAAWAGLLMVIQQIVIIFMQRVFAVSQMSFGFGRAITYDLSWWSEELKLYNAMIVVLCLSYTYVQGGHVRVDLFYARARFRTKKVIDMCGAMFFMVPAAILTWLYAWFFLWRNLVTPTTSASDSFDRMMAKTAALRWNVETISFSPNGFNAYFLFKVLLVTFCLLVLLQAVAVLYRAINEWREGPESANRYLDRDPPADAAAEFAQSH